MFTYSIASANKSIEITRIATLQCGRQMVSKAVRYEDGSCKCFRKTAKGTWANYSRGDMAKKRFVWEMNRANDYLSN